MWNFVQIALAFHQEKRCGRSFAMLDPNRPIARGRGSQIEPPNRFGGTHHEIEFEHLEHDEEYLAGLRRRPTEYLTDRSKTIVAENDSPDVGFRHSINPYRGCLHGCSYCYAPPKREKPRLVPLPGQPHSNGRKSRFCFCG